MEYKEFTGKTAEEAIEAGLNELGLSREEADIRILEEGKKKLFGYVKARVEIAPKAAERASDEEKASGQTESKTPDKNAAETNLEVSNIHRDSLGRTDGERAVEFLEGLLELLKITACTELKREGEKIEIEVTAANTKAIIGRHGEMLDAIQTVAGAVANTGREEYKRVVVDCENYRENREATLQNLAYKLAGKAVRYAEKIKLEPMNPYERRIIHAALSGRQDVTTESEGKEPYRYIVIVPSNLRDPDAPAYSAREERSRGGFGNRGYHRGYNIITGITTDTESRIIIGKAETETGIESPITAAAGDPIIRTESTESRTITTTGTRGRIISVAMRAERIFRARRSLTISLVPPTKSLRPTFSVPTSATARTKITAKNESRTRTKKVALNSRPKVGRSNCAENLQKTLDFFGKCDIIYLN